MKLRIFTIYDRATEAFHQPFFLLTVAEAKRGFFHMANDPESKIHVHHADFQLFHIGDYDNATGIIDTSQGNVSLGTATEYLDTEAKQMEREMIKEAVQ